MSDSVCILFFFFNDTATTEIYTLSLHDALPISASRRQTDRAARAAPPAHYAGNRSTLGTPSDRLGRHRHFEGCRRDRKSTRLNSSHANISYAVFCLKKKTNQLVAYEYQ